MKRDPHLSLRGELSLRRDRHWMVGYAALVLCLPAVMALARVPSITGKGAVVTVAMALAFVGLVRVRCARELERILDESTPVRSDLGEDVDH